MTKTELHELVEALPEESLPSAAILLRRARDPVVARLDAAPYDDEELDEEDLRAIREARSEAGIALSEAEAELNAQLGALLRGAASESRELSDAFLRDLDRLGAPLE